MTAGCSEESRMKQVTSKKIKMLTFWENVDAWLKDDMFSAKRKLQFFEPGCSSESLSSVKP
jgi:hypothetical protein